MRRTTLRAAVGSVGAAVAVASIVAFAGISCDRAGDQRTIDPSQVKISIAQAQAAATRAVPGTVEGIQLRNQQGTAAYAVTIKRPDGSLATVDVNASSGQVVRQQNDAEPDGDGG